MLLSASSLTLILKQAELTEEVFLASRPYRFRCACGPPSNRYKYSAYSNVDQLYKKFSTADIEGQIANSLGGNPNSPLMNLYLVSEENDSTANGEHNLFINTLSAQSGKKIDEGVASELIADAQAIINELEQDATFCEPMRVRRR